MLSLSPGSGVIGDEWRKNWFLCKIIENIHFFSKISKYNGVSEARAKIFVKGTVKSWNFIVLGWYMHICSNLTHFIFCWQIFNIKIRFCQGLNPGAEFDWLVSFNFLILISFFFSNFFFGLMGTRPLSSLPRQTRPCLWPTLPYQNTKKI